MERKLSGAAFFAVVIGVLSYFVFPQSPDPEKGVIYYYQCRDSDSRTVLNLDKLEDSEFKPSGDTQVFFLIHGYTESSSKPWLSLVSQALLAADKESCVVIVDHWNYLTLSRPFMTANVQKIAEHIAYVLVLLKQKSGLRFGNVHVIGFSLGGWISGSVSNYLPEGSKIARITGLDSSFPWKETTDSRYFLDSNDAELVVSIRTSRIGLKLPPTNFDFYVNGGEVQPECDTWWHPDFVQQICSHYKAPLLFAKHLTENSSSFSSCGCPSRASLLQQDCRCESKNSFGLNTIKEVPGTFYYETTVEN